MQQPDEHLVTRFFQWLYVAIIFAIFVTVSWFTVIAFIDNPQGIFNEITTSNQSGQMVVSRPMADVFTTLGFIVGVFVASFLTNRTQLGVRSKAFHSSILVFCILIIATTLGQLGGADGFHSLSGISTLMAQSQGISLLLIVASVLFLVSLAANYLTKNATYRARILSIVFIAISYFFVTAFTVYTNAIYSGIANPTANLPAVLALVLLVGTYFAQSSKLTRFARIVRSFYYSFPLLLFGLYPFLSSPYDFNQLQWFAMGLVLLPYFGTLFVFRLVTSHANKSAVSLGSKPLATARIAAIPVSKSNYKPGAYIAALAVLLLLVLVPLGFAFIGNSQKPVTITAVITSSGGFSGGGTGQDEKIVKRIALDEPFDLGGATLKMVSYDNSKVSIHISGKDPAVLFDGGYLSVDETIGYGNPYDYSNDPGCCDQISYNYHLTFSR